MAKKGCSSIHGEVKKAKSMKATVVVWVPEWNKTKRGKKIFMLSLSFYFILFTHAFIKTKKLLKSCMVESRMCIIV